MSSPPNGLLLITGVTGFIGFKVLLNAIEAGYTIRAAIRSSSKIDSIASHPKVKALAPGNRLSFVEVPDLTVPGAYDEAVKGATYILHLAAPLPMPGLDPQTGIYEPTIKGAMNMLSSAHKEPSIKNVVITSSVFANTPLPPNGEVTAETRVPDNNGPFEDPLTAYRAAKAGALNATDKFVKDNNPSFTVANIFPGFCFGTDDKALEVNDLLRGSTNGMLLPIVMGTDSDQPRPNFASHVYDVAEVHMLALKQGKSGNLGVTIPVTYDDAWEIVKKHFPKAVEAGTFTQGHQPSMHIDWNASKTEAILGRKFKTYEDMVVDVAGQYLEFSGKEKL